MIFSDEPNKTTLGGLGKPRGKLHTKKIDIETSS